MLDPLMFVGGLLLGASIMMFAYETARLVVRRRYETRRRLEVIQSAPPRPAPSLPPDFDD